ncbi:MAG: DegT/DnrJ/EryC1/StrS family aminotransferase, partial [Candidatus Heimdallarchaeota archaeon]|nr:DegT/DnrJ/EryC1/StrS family aminotransferase [Candidatus Heimdallarchaeota archaeon]
MIPPVKINFYENDINEIQQKITEVLQSGMLTLGKYGKQLEEEFASLTNSQHAISTANGTCSIEIILRCLNLKDKEVILPTNTFLATYLAAKSAGCKIKFVDCEEDLNMSLQQVKDAITENTAAVILVHIGGAVAVDTMAIASLCEDKNIYLVEDAAHAHGSYLNGKHAGTFGIAGSFSFYPTKVITSGEGGIIITDNEDIAQRAKVFRDQGKAGFLGNIHTELGYNWRMSELHAVVGIYQVRRLLEFTQQRRDIAKVFDEKLSNTKFKLHKVADPEKSNYYKYILYLPEGTDR